MRILYFTQLLLTCMHMHNGHVCELTYLLVDGLDGFNQWAGGIFARVSDVTLISLSEWYRDIPLM